MRLCLLGFLPAAAAADALPPDPPRGLPSVAVAGVPGVDAVSGGPGSLPLLASAVGRVMKRAGIAGVDVVSGGGPGSLPLLASDDGRVVDRAADGIGGDGPGSLLDVGAGVASDLAVGVGAEWCPATRDGDVLAGETPWLAPAGFCNLLAIEAPGPAQLADASDASIVWLDVVVEDGHLGGSTTEGKDEHVVLEDGKGEDESTLGRIKHFLGSAASQLLKKARDQPGQSRIVARGDFGQLEGDERSFTAEKGRLLAVEEEKGEAEIAVGSSVLSSIHISDEGRIASDLNFGMGQCLVAFCDNPDFEASIAWLSNTVDVETVRRGEKLSDALQPRDLMKSGVPDCDHLDGSAAEGMDEPVAVEKRKDEWESTLGYPGFVLLVIVGALWILGKASDCAPFGHLFSPCSIDPNKKICYGSRSGSKKTCTILLFVAGASVALGKVVNNVDDSSKGASSQLRGGNHDVLAGPSSLNLIVEAKETLELQLRRMKALQDGLSGSSNEEASKLMASYFEEVKSSVAQVSQLDIQDSASEFHTLAEGFPQELAEMDKALRAGSISPKELASAIADEGISNFMKDAIGTLQDAIDSKGSSLSRRLRPLDATAKKKLSHHEAFVSPDAGLGLDVVKSLPSRSGHDVKLPELRFIQQLRKLKEARGDHSHRRLEQPPECPSCESGDYICNCGRLFECAKNITAYDLAVLLLGGFVEGEGNNRGKLALKNMEGIQVFDGRNLRSKMQTISGLANGDISEQTCDALLSEFHTACKDDSCTSPNAMSFHLSVNDVCAALNTRAKLDMEVMGRYYEFSNWATHGRFGGIPFRGRCARDNRQTGGNLSPHRGVRLEPSWDNRKKVYLRDCISFCGQYNDHLGYRGFNFLGDDRIWVYDDECICFFDADTYPGLPDPPDPSKGWRLSEYVSSSTMVGELNYLSELGEEPNVLAVCYPHGIDSYVSPPQPKAEHHSARKAVRCCKRFTRNEKASQLVDSDKWIPSLVLSESSHMDRCPHVMKQVWTGDTLFRRRHFSGETYCWDNRENFGEGYRRTSMRPCVNGFSQINERKCTDDNSKIEVDLEDYEGNPDVGHGARYFSKCAEACAKTSNCRSFTIGRWERSDGFGYFSAECVLWSDCDHYTKTQSSAPHTWYFKFFDLVPSGYTKYDAGGCEGRDELGEFGTETIQDCANLCSEQPSCVSFEYTTNEEYHYRSEDSRYVIDGGKGVDEYWHQTKYRDADVVPSQVCRLSSSCTDTEMTNKDRYDPMKFYLKNEIEAGDRDECPFLTFHEAEEYCADEGARLCTQSELEDDCAALTGCGFDLTQVWSATEASPEGVCASFASCGDFAGAFERLYKVRNQDDFSRGNPMREDPDQEIVSSDLTNIQFPMAVNWNEPGADGSRSYDGYLYDGGVSKESGLFCGSKLGPPTALAKACDKSLNLLGGGMSIGQLTATVKTVEEYVIEGSNPSLGTPKWLNWYTSLKDNYTEDFVAEWTSAYERINESVDPPDWLYYYLTIPDMDPLYNPQMEGGHLYCKDATLSEGDTTLNIRTCPKDWLEQKTNPYDQYLTDFMTKYESYPYPASNVPNSPFKKSCSYEFCQEAWLETTNPFSKADNEGCHAFYNECRGLVPPEYQCHRFYNHCRNKLVEIDSYWEYSYPPGKCSESSTCLLSWLDLDTQPFAPEDNFACYRFVRYCRKEFAARFPDHAYPTTKEYCEGNPELTCKEDWLNQETNPFDETAENKCHTFWTFCRTRLLEKHPRYSYPPYSEVTIDDIMPGYCCLDGPGDAEMNTKFWGEPYTASREKEGMVCQKRGDWHFGLSAEACANGGGVFYPTPCITLYRCIENRPDEGDGGFNRAFEDWVRNEVHIYDPSNLEQCKQARRALGYDEDHLGDKRVCETFRAWMCDDFFLDLAWVDDAKDKPAKFEQVVYDEISYPDDKPLYMKELPPYDPPTEEIQPKTIEGEAELIKGLEEEVASFELITGEYYDRLSQLLDEAELIAKKEDAGCDAFETTFDKSRNAFEYSKERCAQQNVVAPPGVTNPAYVVCQETTMALLLVAQAAQTAWKGCKSALNWVKVVKAVARWGLWAGLQRLKSQLGNVQSRLDDMAISKFDDLETHRFTKATYYHQKHFNKWSHESLGRLNVNMVEQHNQMREDLQKRHEDITNDVNQYTTCIVNYLGNQIFEQMNAETDPLSSTCASILGLDSGRRRLEEHFRLNVRWKEGSLFDRVRDIYVEENEQEETLKNITGELRQVEDKEDGIIETLQDVTRELLRMESKEDDIIADLNKIKEHFGIDAAGEHGAKSEKAQAVKTKFKNVFAVEDEVDTGDAHDLGTRRLMRFEGKLESMEGKMESMEAEAKSMKGKMESMEAMMAKLIGQNERLMDIIEKGKGADDK